MLCFRVSQKIHAKVWTRERHRHTLAKEWRPWCWKEVYIPKRPRFSYGWKIHEFLVKRFGGFGLDGLERNLTWIIPIHFPLWNAIWYWGGSMVEDVLFCVWKRTTIPSKVKQLVVWGCLAGALEKSPSVLQFPGGHESKHTVSSSLNQKDNLFWAWILPGKHWYFQKCLIRNDEQNRETPH